MSCSPPEPFSIRASASGPNARPPPPAKVIVRQGPSFMNLRNISAWSIRNPVPSIVLFVALTIAGVVSFMRMEVNDNPPIEFPLVSVGVSQPGAAPTELETQVTQRIEAAVRGVNGVDEI